MKKKNRKLTVLYFKCQFCEEESPASEWKENQCPRCKKRYDPMLAQEGDD